MTRISLLSISSRHFTARVLLFLAGILCLQAGAFAQNVDVIEEPLSLTELDFLRWVDDQEESMLSLLETITNINSGTLNKEGMAEVAAIFARELNGIGFATETLSGDLIEMPHCPNSDINLDLPDHLLATKGGEGTRLLLMGHMDTVFPIDSPFQEFRRDGDMIRGPGVFDMKGGLVIMLYALKALDEFGLLDNRTISVLLNSDEEMGSLSSRKYLEEQAARHDYGLVFEGSVENRQIRERKGLGQARFVVYGRASHAGAAHQDGRSAIRELAYKVIELENMTDYESGLTVNVGLIGGGEARNMVSPCAEALVDLRYPLPAQGIAARDQFETIAETSYSVPGGSDDIRTEAWINLHRPPKIATPESDHLLNRTIAIGALLGEEIGVADSGGGTDGSLTQATGLPTLDSLGIGGFGAHSQREVAEVASLIRATRRAAVLMYRLLNE